MHDLFKLKGQTALITGASSGLGAHFASVLAQAGADVVLAARRIDQINALAEKISAQTQQKALAVQTDVKDAQSVAHAFDEAERALATPTIIVNNAGLAHSNFAQLLSEEEWHDVIETNLSAVWRIAKEAANRMIKASSAGAIINISSILAERPGPMLASYAASKAGVKQLTRTMAIELARHNIRVNALAPGYFRTAISGDFLDSEAGIKMTQRIPMRRTGALDELSGPLLLLASRAGAYMTGAMVIVDGGHLSAAL